MKKLLTLLLLLSPSLAQGQAVTNPSPVAAAGAYNSVAPTCTNNAFCWLQLDVNGNLKVTGTFTPSGSSPEFTPVAPATATATVGVLLGAQATTAAVNPTNGQQAALSSDTNNNLLVSAGGAPNLTIAQVSIATSDTLAIAARALRRSVTIQQITGTQNVFCNQTTATAGNGIVLPAVVGASITLNTTSAVRCIAITGAQTVAIAETY